MATNQELQARVAELEAQLGSDARVAELEAQLAQSQTDNDARVAQLEAQLARQAEEDSAEVRMVRYKHATGSIVRVDEDYAKATLDGNPDWTKVK